MPPDCQNGCPTRCYLITLYAALLELAHVTIMRLNDKGMLVAVGANHQMLAMLLCFTNRGVFMISVVAPLLRVERGTCYILQRLSGHSTHSVVMRVQDVPMKQRPDLGVATRCRARKTALVLTQLNVSVEHLAATICFWTWGVVLR
jgi:hypothetical protein